MPEISNGYGIVIVKASTEAGAGVTVAGEPETVKIVGESAVDGEQASVTLTADNRIRVETRPTYDDNNAFAGQAWRGVNVFQSKSAW